MHRELGAAGFYDPHEIELIKSRRILLSMATSTVYSSVYNIHHNTLPEERLVDVVSSWLFVQQSIVLCLFVLL